MRVGQVVTGEVGAGNHSLLVDGDNRKQGDADKAKFCGAGALSMNDRDHYAVLMRVALLSSRPPLSPQASRRTEQEARAVTRREWVDQAMCLR